MRMGLPRKQRPVVAAKTELPPVEMEVEAEHQQNLYVISSMLDESGEVVNVMSMSGLEGAVVDGEGIQFDLHPHFLHSQHEHEIEVHAEHPDDDTGEELGQEVILGGHESDSGVDTYQVVQEEEQMNLELDHLEQKPDVRVRSHKKHKRSENEVLPVSDKVLRHIMTLPPVPKIKNKDVMVLPFTYAGQSFSVQAQKLILNVYDFFKRHKRDPFILRRLGTPQEQASKILNVSASVIGRIRNRFTKIGKIVVPGLKRKKVKRILDNVNSDDEQVIRELVQELSARRIPPTVPLLLCEVRDRINFVGSRTSFRRVLLRMGFKYAKVNKKTIIVDPNQRHTLSSPD